MSRARITALAAAFLLCLSACSSSEDEATPSPETPEATIESQAPNDPVPVSCEEQETGPTSATISIGGVERDFLINVPSSYDPAVAIPVVYELHGLGSNATQMQLITRFNEVGEQRGFITVAPQGVGDLPGWDFRTPADVPGSDAEFLRLLVEHVETSWCTDPSRAYLSGFSNGSAMTLAAACWGDLGFAAYAGVAAAGFDTSCVSDSVELIYFHGVEDRVVPIDGGMTPIDEVAPLDETLASWGAHLACDDQPVEADLGGGAEHLVWSGCAAGNRLEAYILEGQGHVWPAAPDASELIVEFFDL